MVHLASQSTNKLCKYLGTTIIINYGIITWNVASSGWILSIPWGGALRYSLWSRIHAIGPNESTPAVCIHSKKSPNCICDHNNMHCHIITFQIVPLHGIPVLVGLIIHCCYNPVHVKWISLYFTCQDDYKLLLSNCHCPSKETAIVNIGWSGRRNLPFYVLLYFWHANAVGRAWIQVKVVFMFRVTFQYQTNVIVCVQYRPNMASGKCWIVETKCGTRSMKVEKGSPSVSSVHILTYDCAL